MTLQDVKNRLDYIESIKDDDESAHGAQDDLFEDFIKAIVNNEIIINDLVEIAKEVLQVKKIDFCRWCA
jgi:hypothetical protein